MSKLKKLEEALETLAIEIAATKQQRDLALEPCNRAALRQHRQGVKKHGDRVAEMRNNSKLFKI